jgi:hypothetical protein
VREEEKRQVINHCPHWSHVQSTHGRSRISQESDCKETLFDLPYVRRNIIMKYYNWLFAPEPTFWRDGNFNSCQVKSRQAMIVKRNIEARSCIHCGRGNAISITHSESVFVTLVIQHAMGMRHSVICDLSRPKIFLHIIS